MKESQRWFILAMLALTGWLVYLLAPILTPFAMAAILAYLGDPFTDWLETHGLSRTMAVVIVFMLFTLGFAILLLVLIPSLEDQVARLVRQLPAILQFLEGKIRPWIDKVLGPDYDLFDIDRIRTMLKEHYQQVGGFAASLLGSISRSGMAIIAWLMNLVLVPVVTFYLLRDWDKLLDRLHALLPRRLESTVARLARECDQVLGAFLRGQLTVMLALGTIYSVGLWLVGLDLAMLIGMIAGLISFVPYLGAIVGVALGVIAALFQFQEILPVVWVLVVFGLGQTLEGYVLTPMLVGDRIGLHPVAVIFAILAGGQLFGFLGVLIALPAAALIMVLLRYAHEQYKQSDLYGPEPPPDGDEASPEEEPAAP
ncbi:MAG: AI-2E family transporter [Xanthomonadales bacterium]|nr:AI-2E family transporter [Xanthomonadales bacterium]